MEGQGTTLSPAAAAPAISAVLDNDDLLCEILLRVAFPTSLVRAALPPELADVVRRGSFYLNTFVCDDFDVDCWNGLLLLTYHVHNQPPVRILRCPLYPARHTAILPAVPNTSIHDGLEYEDREIFPNGSGDGPSYFYLAIGSNMQQTIVDVYVLQDNFNFPEEVDALNAGMSLADDSGVHLAHVKDLQIRIWLHKIDPKGFSNWFLVNTVCLREMCTNNMIPICGFEDADEFIKVHAVGENSEFVLLKAENVLYLFDIKRNVAKKDVTQKNDPGR
uniref:Uncharacterized protein n=1 Tax=Avena sativa TaxID=4498 RepID=A0ACD5XHB5_AVESA